MWDCYGFRLLLLAFLIDILHFFQTLEVPHTHLGPFVLLSSGYHRTSRILFTGVNFQGLHTLTDILFLHPYIPTNLFHLTRLVLDQIAILDDIKMRELANDCGDGSDFVRLSLLG